MLGYNLRYYEEKLSIHTVREVLQQPDTWLKTYYLIKEQKEQIQNFLKKISSDVQIILTGAGSSEFVGKSIVYYIGELVENDVRFIPTTDIVDNPLNFFKKNRKVLLVSYGRSGSSPESLATVELAEQYVFDLHHLIITCNHEGQLANFKEGDERVFHLNLPKETHDQSFAMTSSFTNMMLATMLFFNVDRIEDDYFNIFTLMELVNDFILNNYEILDGVVEQFDFKKIVYLGASNLNGIAQESALKMLELSAGNVYTMHNTPLGFRHGPKSIMSEDVLTVFYLQRDDYANKYVMDLLHELIVERTNNKIIVVTPKEIDVDADYIIHFDIEKTMHEVYLGFMYIVIGQVLALKKAISMNISCDNPSPSGSVNRVVQGVKIYECKK